MIRRTLRILVILRLIGSARGISGPPPGCFHGDDVVIGDDRRPSKIADMRSAAESGSAKWLCQRAAAGRAAGGRQFCAVEFWMHFDPGRHHDFLRIETESGRSVRLTKRHLVYRIGGCRGNGSRAVFAERVRPGDCLLTTSTYDGLRPTAVIAVVEERLLGAYAPITTSGNLFVNDILVSCYTNVENEVLQHILFSFFRSVRPVLEALFPSWVADFLYSTKNRLLDHIPFAALFGLNAHDVFTAAA